MSLSAKNRLGNADFIPVKTDFAPGERPLYFHNKGLFSDPFLAHHLPEIEEKNLNDSSSRYLNEFWNKPSYEGATEFNQVYAQMISLWDQYSEIFPGLNEAQLEERWIRPVLKLLGWTYEVQDSMTKQAKRNIPDYSLFSSEDQYIKAKRTKTDEAYFGHVLAVADAKAWKVALDGIGRQNSNPSYQIVRYMEHAGVQWSILTNGRFWRLYSLRSNSKHTTYYEVDLETLLVKRDDKRFKYFYNFFRKDAFEKGTSSQCFLDVVFENGMYYAKDVEENLKRRIFEVVDAIAKGFVGGAKLEQKELRKVYEHSLYYLFRLMFILNCESKGLLAVSKTSDYYEHSLRKLITNLKSQYDGNQKWSSQTRTYNLITDLFELLAKGDDRIGVHGFGKEVFSSGDKTFFDKNRIPDHYLNEALVQLACDYSDDNDEMQFIDYKRLSEDHLGSLFEGLLEYELKYAEEKMAILKTGRIETWKNLSEKQKKDVSSTVIESGTPYLASGSGERHTTGSYYTPSNVVDHICKQTLRPLVEDKKSIEILKLKIIDPAMGSAHFLLGVIKFLEDSIQEKINSGDDSIDEVDSSKIRWNLLHNCIYGADLNPLAVELAKFSLWMFTASLGNELEPLSDQLVCGDSLSGKFGKNSASWRDVFQAVFAEQGFDAVVGNPPWGAGFSEIQKKELRDKFPEVADYESAQYFVSLAVRELLKPDGKFGLIVPNTVALNVYAKNFRDELLKKCAIEQVVDLTQQTVFADPSVRSIVLVGSKTTKIPKKIDVSRYVSEGEFEFDSLPYTALKESENWTALISGNGATNTIVEKLKKTTILLSDICEVKQGYIPYRTSTLERRHGKAKAKEILEKRLWHSNKNEGKDYRKELQGKDVERYVVSWSGTWVKYGEWVSTYLPIELFSGPRILIREITGKPPYVLKASRAEDVYINNPSILIAKTKTKWPSDKFITGILNSKAASAIFLSVAPKAKKGLFPKVLITDAKRILMPNLDKTNRKHLQVHDQIASLVGKIESLLGSTKKGAKVDSDIAELNAQIDQLAYEAYGLSEKEISTIEKMLSGSNEQSKKAKKAA